MTMLALSEKSRKAYAFVFPLFLFFSAIFCMSTRVNNLFHLSFGLFILSLFSADNRQRLAVGCQKKLPTLILVALMIVYYAISNIWGGTLEGARSALTHGTYLLVYLLILTTLLEEPKSRHIVLASIVAGITVLAIYTLMTDYSLVLKLRKVSLSNPGPQNVIDLAGYCGIGILLSCMLLKETKKHIYYIPLIITLIMMLFAQSRGPIMALAIAFVLTLHRTAINRRNILLGGLIAILLAIICVFTPVGEMLLGRFEVVGKQSGLRLSIWHHTLEELSHHFWLGRGYLYELGFTNYNGQYITTTHSVYLGALLKGGIIGFGLLLAVIASGLVLALKKFRNQDRYDVAIFIFALIFMASQGMFIISNPRESWVLFWLPLGLILSRYPR
ncbi:O-antigen ligase family protein [Cronobacter turicensis]|nr:O-antigen ligase family protein [Cronobacter turicensis]ELY5814996.1 O-antigen ligase family protein [Cronobacter turicensis]